ncbi:succinate-semialdehyde dehydrogenase/glutarate-semialdehyde dehydrogenase [Streptomyces brevispora]|uniref:Succinate-semialdehyde dehydrogenase/glutarate-semialdehyde dehydrogenase n=1 Tax=Streptomyces brevispora TaxID=887462 RepID=A0A561UX05_9ACTN|nr:aldehyde dehydrogenase family protein [Streptomyces brevispora]TWG03879.1 succinate-semialdehyde dehydrogenase/glutarate-semialdehyde dehydrogenase [Streptomyces brevispora]
MNRQPPPLFTATTLLGGPLPAAAQHAMAVSGTGPVSDVRSLMTGRPAATIPHSTPADVLTAIATAALARQMWSQSSAGCRRNVLAGLHTWITRHRTYLCALLAHGSGLCGADATAESRDARRTVRHSRTRPDPLAFIRRQPPQPPGTVATHADDCRPLVSLLEAAVPALLNGSAVISHVSPRTAVLAARLCAAATASGLPPGTWQMVVAAPGSLTAAVLDEHVDTVVPRCCPETTPGTRRPGLLVVRHDANLRTAVTQARHACFGRAGRGCTAAPLVVVHDRHHDALLSRLTATAARLPAGAMSCLPGSRPSESFAHFVRCVTADGPFRPVLTGTPRPDISPYLHEAVVATAALDPELPATVPPGPLALVMRYSHWSDVLALARHTGRHTTLITNARSGYLTGQFACLAANDIHINRHPRHGQKAAIL